MACGATLSLKRNLEFDPLHSPSHQRTPKRRRCIPMTLSPSTPPTKQNQINPSPFSEVTPKITSDQIAAQINAEVRRMHRRKQLHYPMSPSASPPHSGGSTPPPSCQHTATSDSMACSSAGPSGSTSRRDQPLLTLRQVGLLCETLLREREDAIREEYDKVLTDRLAEQYEAFLRFNHDQIRRQFADKPASYLS